MAAPARAKPAGWSLSRDEPDKCCEPEPREHHGAPRTAGTATPIVMVNLLKYAEPGGRERYARYGAVAGPEIAARGGRALYTGSSVAGSDWDGVALVYYPRRAAWLDMQDSPAYRAAIADRTAGLSARLLYAFTQGAGPLPVKPPPLEDVHRQSEDEIFVVNLLRYRGDEGRESFLRYGEVASRLIHDRGGRVEMTLVADQAMVSDGRVGTLRAGALPVVRRPPVHARERRLAGRRQGLPAAGHGWDDCLSDAAKRRQGHDAQSTAATRARLSAANERPLVLLRPAGGKESIGAGRRSAGDGSGE